MKISLVLGGGGARGYFHIGVIKKLRDLGIDIEEISGCSFGAIVGLLYCSNPLGDIERIMVEDFNLAKTMKFGFFKNALIDLKKLETFLRKYSVDKFEKLKIPLSFNATDINTGKEIIFSKGNIFPGVVASASVPGIFKPLDYNGKLLIDGGIASNVPIDNLQRTKRILAINVAPDPKKVTKNSKTIDIWYNSVRVMQNSMTLKQVNEYKKNIVYIDKDFSNSPFNFTKKNAKECIKKGYDAINLNAMKPLMKWHDRFKKS